MPGGAKYQAINACAFGTWLALFLIVLPIEGQWRESGAMEDGNNSFTVRYAIVEAAQTSSEAERFVLAYRSESSLYEFLVSSCIVASGYRSREEAARDCALGETVALLAAA